MPGLLEHHGGACLPPEPVWARRVLVVLVALGSLLPLGTAVAARLAAGSSHACAVADDGNTFCWGSNVYRQLGDGTQTDRDGPVRVKALSAKATAIAAGWNHACIITPTAGVQCWGLNEFGQLGNGSTEETDAAVDVVGLSSGVKAVVGGRRHGCALLQSGSMQCWGANDYGQLGTGDTIASPVPVTVSGLGNTVTGIAAGDFSTCAIVAGGAAKCWGRNDAGQLGTGTYTDNVVPTPVVGLDGGVAEISIDSLGACAVLESGAVTCWGYILGAGDLYASSNVPIEVLPADSASSVRVGYDHRCVRLLSGAVACWGLGRSGAIGDGALVDRSVPTEVAQLNGPLEIATGLEYSCALLASGEIHCWGYGANGQLGHGRPARRSVPVGVLVQGDDSIVKMALGPYHACASMASGSMQCWGYNVDGQLGDGTTLSRSLPAPVTGGLVHEAVAVGELFTCSVAADSAFLRQAYCWGEGSLGSLGNGGFATTPEPTPVTGSTDVIALASRVASTCAIVSTGRARCWGDNGHGQIGFAGGALPMPPNNLSGLLEVSMGESHACALQSPGAVHCWGTNDFGQLGDGTRERSEAPVGVIGLDGPAISVSAGNGQTCVVLADGAVKCWGRMFDGVVAGKPTLVSGLEAGVQTVSLAKTHGCVLRMDETVRCWGMNAAGELGDASFVSRTAPVEPVGLGGGVRQVVVADLVTCAALLDGSARCWGANFSGQLGNGEQGYAPVPERVSGTPLSGVIFRDGME